MTESPLNDRTVALRTFRDYDPEAEAQPQAEDEWNDEQDSGDGPLSMYFHITFGGGDPTATRVRDVSVTIPLRPEDSTSAIATMVSATVAALVGLGRVESFDADVIAGGQ